MPDRGAHLIDEDGLDALIETLGSDGFEVIGPVVDNGVISRAPIASRADLPRGWRDAQEPGHYRLEHTDDPRYFAFAVGPESPRRNLNPSEELMWSADRGDDGEVRVAISTAEPSQIALFGVRSCDAHARAILDRVMIGGDHVDPAYAARRTAQFAVVVECAESASTCFCVSMETGPAIEGAPFDLALTELIGDHHRFLVRVGSDAGAEVLDRVPHRAAGDRDVSVARAVVAGAADQQRSIRTDGLPARLEAMIEHPRWDDVASRCISCGNCTMVCPTCFCHGEEERSSLDGAHTERWRQWDSCFSLDHSYVHPEPVRATTRARYRQWLTHKLGTWHEQFGTSGCVGCGRCITWCPPGIDITAEAAALWQDPQ